MSNCSPSSTLKDCICGPDEEEPLVKDTGSCFPYRVKITCAAPSVPVTPCNDTTAYAEARPGESPPFVIIATIYDENCDPIQDENSLPILSIS